MIEIDIHPERKRVAVIGGGPAGLAAIKILKEEGCEPTCFEKSDDIGGTWKYREQDVPGMASIMWTAIANNSKHFLWSTYLMPKNMPNYLRHRQVIEYIRSFAEKFDLLGHIVFNTEIINIKKTSDYEETGRWLVTVKNKVNSVVETKIFDGVLVCSGHLCYPKMAEYPEMDKFEGEIMHTHSLKKVDKFYDKAVVVVGTGCSALDAAVAISDVAKQVYLSIRTPSWILSRFGPHGMPMDCSLYRRYLTFLQKILPLRLLSWIIEQYISNYTFNHKIFGIKPKYPLLSRDPIVSDGLAPKLLVGSAVLRKDICRFSKGGIIFEGEDKVTEVDTVIMATGYTWKLDFLEEGIINIENGRFNLYKCMYPTHLKHPTLALIGFILPLGPGTPLGELQIRWAAHLLANNKELPCEEIMLKDAKQRHEANCKRYSPSEKMSIRIDFMPYADEIATELGVMPNFWKMAFTDPRLFVACIFGICIPAQYRLVGPNKWEGAREAILTASERLHASPSGETLKNNKIKIYAALNIFIPSMIACFLCWMGLPLYYVAVLFVVCCMLKNNVFLNCFLISFLIAYSCGLYRLAAIYI